MKDKNAQLLMTQGEFFRFNSVFEFYLKPLDLVVELPWQRQNDEGEMDTDEPAIEVLCRCCRRHGKRPTDLLIDK